jgi:cell division protein FtsQ
MRNARNLRPPDSVRVLDNPRKPPDLGSQRGKPDAGSVTGRSVRIERERQHTEGQPKARRMSRAKASLITIAVVSVLAVIVYFSPAFAVKVVQVDGGWHLRSDRLTELAQVPTDATLLRVDIDAIVERVTADPWVSSVVVSRQFPSTLRLNIEEREPVAAVVLAGADPSSGRGVWLLAADGVWLGEVLELGDAVQGVDISRLVRIEDAIDSVLPVSGEPVAELALSNALAIVNGFSPSMRSRVTYISAPSVVGTTIYLGNHVEVAFGAAEDVELKEVVINQLINEHGDNLLRINVRVADRPTVRLAE